MKESAALHRLIHSLTKNEKRYFNLFASTHRDSSDYLRIFKAIDEQEFYNENLLKELLNRSGTIEHFPVKKNQLYQLLLRAMRVYHEGRTFDATLKEMMTKAVMNTTIMRLSTVRICSPPDDRITRAHVDLESM